VHRFGSIVEYANGEYAMIIDYYKPTNTYIIRFLVDEEEIAASEDEFTVVS